jgi:peptide/nickel transport system ATP-binding protein
MKYDNNKRQDNKVLLEIENLNVKYFSDYGIVNAVNDLSYKLNRGKCIGVVGESGCGKSTHARAIIRLISPLAGTYKAKKIWFNGLELQGLSNKQMCKIRGSEIAMVFQDPMSSLNPVLKVGEQIAECLILHENMNKSEALKRSEELLKLVRIPDAKERLQSYPHQLSGGMQQRVMIAMSLSCNPKLLIADEPTTALDVTIQSRIIDLVTDIRKEFNMAIMWITHNLGVVASIAETCNVMYAGYIIECGNVTDIYTRQLHPYTQGLLNSLPNFKDKTKKLSSIIGSPPNLLSIPKGCAFAPRCLYAKEICNHEKPGLKKSHSEDHLVACHFWEEIEEQRKNKESSTKQRIINKHDNKQLEKKELILSVRGLKTYFPITRGIFQRHIGNVKAVDGVSFDIRKGETLGLVGESGSGKTTIGHSIIRLIEPNEGSVFFQKENITKLSIKKLNRIRPKIQIIFQNPYSSLNPKHNVKTILSTPMEVCGVLKGEKRINRLKELLTMVDLNPDYLNRYPHEFSGGQQQRIGIARALALEPDLIICDEPISSLDVSIQAQIVNLLKKLQRDFGITYLFISHDLNMSHYICDRIAVMYLGKIVELSDRVEIFDNPQHPYAKLLLSAVLVPDPNVKKKSIRILDKDEEIPSAANPPKGCNFNTRCHLAKEICFQSEPEYKEIKPGHYCSCHLI